MTRNEHFSPFPCCAREADKIFQKFIAYKKKNIRANKKKKPAKCKSFWGRKRACDDLNGRIRLTAGNAGCKNDQRTARSFTEMDLNFK